MEWLNPDAFSDHLKGMTYHEVIARLSRHLPPDLKYSAKLGRPSLYPGDLKLFFEGTRGTLKKDISFVQTIDWSRGRTNNGEIVLLQPQNNAGTFLSYNFMLLSRDLGLLRREFTTANLGAYAWSRMGANVDFNPDHEDAKKWNIAKRQILSETAFLLQLLGLEEHMASIDLEKPDGLWTIADILARPLLTSGNKFLDFNNVAEHIPNETLDYHLKKRVDIMINQYSSGPAQITAGQLVLFGKEFPAYFNLTCDDEASQKQWARMTSYMARKGYPDLQTQPAEPRSAYI